MTFPTYAHARSSSTSSHPSLSLHSHAPPSPSPSPLSAAAATPDTGAIPLGRHRRTLFTALIDTGPSTASAGATRRCKDEEEEQETLAPVPATVRARSRHPTALVVFFILLTLNCLLSSISTTSRNHDHNHNHNHNHNSNSNKNKNNPLQLFLPCEANPRSSNGNKRVDAPSSDDFAPLTGPDFAFTSQTLLGSLSDARQYVDGALATQKLVAAPMIPIHRQMWPGVNLRTAYFGNNYSADKISQVPQLLQAGMRRLVIDLWWDAAGVGWQLCPRIKRDVGQLRSVRLALEQEQLDLEALLQVQRMGSHQVEAQEQKQQQDVLLEPLPSSTAASEALLLTTSTNPLVPTSAVLSPQSFSDHKYDHIPEHKRRLQQDEHHQQHENDIEFLEKRATLDRGKDEIQTPQQQQQQQRRTSRKDVGLGDKRCAQVDQHDNKSGKSYPPTTNSININQKKAHAAAHKKGANREKEDYNDEYDYGDEGKDGYRGEGEDEKDDQEDADDDKDKARAKDESFSRTRRRQRTHSESRDWFRKKRPHQRPAIKVKSVAQDQVHGNSNENITASEIPANNKRLAEAHAHRGSLHRLAMSKGKVAAYDKSLARDQTVDGITCSTGEDLTMLLQELQSWIQQTSENELEDVLLIILNLNEFGNNSLGSRPPPHPTPTPSPTPSPVPTPINGTNITTEALAVNNTVLWPLSDEAFFQALKSPNTNKIVEALLPNIPSLKDLFMDAFPSLIYSPTQLEMDRADLLTSWWKSSPVGLDYYNTTMDPLTGRISAPAGWPTSLYLTEVIKRRIVVGIGVDNLVTNTTYNVTDDYTTLYSPDVLGPSMSNSSLLRISSSLIKDKCEFPVPGVAMIPTGTEDNSTNVTTMGNSSDKITSEVSWSFSSMSDSDLAPWSFDSGQLATSCGFSALVNDSSHVLTYSEHAAMTIWSWDLDQPPLNQTRSRDRRCGAMQSNGRWAVQDCNMKLPVACRQLNTSSKWIIYDKGANNYRDVTCPEGYKFDVPRTARENQILYTTLLSYWNDTTPSFYALLIDRQRYEQQLVELDAKGPYGAILNTASSSALSRTPQKKEGDDGSYVDDHNENGGDFDEERKERSSTYSQYHRHEQPLKDKEKVGVTTTKELADKAPPFSLSPQQITGMIPGGGMVWIDISSWQTAGCWVPGGMHGICPYQAPDNTVALQEIIKVSSISGVIVLLLVGTFLYLKCRRNVRLRKANKRRANVRNKIMRTEVETVPA
ncbi:hypothetical protein EDD11_007085 [Mortierella claussenii]|nr:hypothetical protein EDD11_007085 [Mortierella claussenii]